MTNAQRRGLPLSVIETDERVPALKLSNDLKRRKRERIERGAEGDSRGLRLLALSDHLKSDGIVTELPSLVEVKWDLLAHHKFRVVHPHEIADMVEVFARGHSLFCAAQPVPMWHSPDLIYQMSHWKARRLFEWFGTFSRKVYDAELKELVRSALLNRYTFILYARDMVRFNDLQKDYHFRRGRHPKVFRTTLNYHLTAFYIHVWGMLDSLAGIANRQLGLGVHPFRCGITQNRFLDALSQKRPGLARFIKGHRSKWIDVLGDVRHPVAHSALRLQSDVVRSSEDSRKTDAEISDILRREDPETYAVLPRDMLRALEWSSQDLVDSSSIRAVAEGDADVHEGERGASPFDVRVHQGQ